MNVMLKVFWQNLLPVNRQSSNQLVLNIPFGTMAPGAPVQSVNGQIGHVMLGPGSVGADAAGSADDVREDLQPQITDLSNNKLDAVDYEQHFKGVYPSYSALISAHPTANDGDYAHIDSGPGFGRLVAIWDGDEWPSGEWRIQQAGAASNTDEVPEGSINLYHTGARVRATPLTGLVLGAATPILATDQLLAAMAKLQAQISAMPAPQVWVSLVSTQDGIALTDDSGNYPLQVSKSEGLIFIRGSVFRKDTGSFTQSQPIAELPAGFELAGTTDVFPRTASGVSGWFENGSISIAVKPTANTIHLGGSLFNPQYATFGGCLGLAKNP